MQSLVMLALEVAGLSARPVIRQSALLLGAALIFLVIGLTGLIGARWIVLARATDPAVAALIMGGAGFLLAGVTLLIARAHMRPQAPALSLKDAEAALSALMSKEGSGVWGPVAAAAVIGFLITRRT